MQVDFKYSFEFGGVEVSHSFFTEYTCIIDEYIKLLQALNRLLD